MEQIYTQIRQYIDENQQPMLKLWRDLVNTESGTLQIDGVNAVCSILRREMENAGIHTRVRAIQNSGDMLIGEWNPGSSKAPLLLIGHMDTVFKEGAAKDNPFRVDENGKPVEICFRERGESEKLIEEFMLQANEAVAEFMCKREHPTVYRVHENPDPDKLRAFAQFARPFGYRIDASTPEDTAQFQVVLRGAKNDPKQRVLPTLLLRSLARARYADECIGHYGLKAKYYLHFTSPIRRYPDLIAHWMLQKALTGEEFTAADENLCAEAAQQSTNREQAADNCERDIDKLFIASYMKQFIGEEFDGEVSGVQSFGIFVALANGCEGLVRAELMTGDFYQYDEEHMAMVGRRTGKRFTIGSPLRVKLIAASEVTGQIDFAPADGALPLSDKPERAPRGEDSSRPPYGNRASRRRHSHGKGRSGGQKGRKPPTRKRK